jgi:2-polyprenyl-3-methyl-5-hydroxy-6-metoxy-1,4-benzoquinol methylase
MQCKICNNTRNHRHFSVKEMMLGLRDEHAYFECTACGCLQIATIPDNIADYYPENYYSYHAKPPAKGLKKFLLRSRNKYAVTERSWLGKKVYGFSPEYKLTTLRRLVLKKNARILDVGCGAGDLLQSLYSIGFKNSMGIDPYNDDDIHYPSGLSIKKLAINDLLTNDHEQEGWDLIMFHHSFEHIADQHGTLKAVKDLLKPNGVCLLRIPTISSYAWEHYEKDWVQLDAPRHFFLHSVNSMKMLAAWYGFVLEHIEYDSNAFQFWGSEQYKQDIPLRDSRSYAENPKQSPFSKRKVKRFARRARALNAEQQGDQAAFYFRKPATKDGLR